MKNRPQQPGWLICLLAAQALWVGGCATIRMPRIDPCGQSIFLADDCYAPPEPMYGVVVAPATPDPCLGPPVAADCFDGLVGGPVAGRRPIAGRGWFDGSLLDRLCFGGFRSLPETPPPGECAAPVDYGWTPHPLLVQPPAPIAAPVAPGRQPSPLIAPPQPLLPYGYDTGDNLPYNTNAVASTGGDPFGAHNARLRVNPRRLVAPVGQTVVLQGAICGSNGYFIKNQPIEWSISPDSVGTIVEVDRTDQRFLDRWLRKPPLKRSGSYAVGRTSRGPQVLPRDIANPTDDVHLGSGQTWISISSASEGSTHVAAVAPTVIGWQERQQNATIHWVDGRWQFPSPVISSYGGGHTLTTRVARATDGAPVEGWLVRYEVAGGAPAAFDANGAQVSEVPTNSNGEASVIVVPQGEFSGTTQITMQVIRRGRTPGDLPRLPVGQGSTAITWTSSGTPSLPLGTGAPIPQPQPQLTETPILTARVSGVSVAEVGATATYQFRVENVGNAAADNVNISSPVPQGLRYEESSPQAGVFGDTLRWELGPLEPGMVRSVTVTYRVEGDNTVELCATASAATAQDATDCVTTQVRTNRASIDVQIQGDQSARVGDQVHYDLYINNLSDRPLTEVVVIVDFDDGLRHDAGLSPIDHTFGVIDPRSTITQPLNFTVLSEGRRRFRVTTTTAEGARDQEEQFLEVAPNRTPPSSVPQRQLQSPAPGFDLPPASATTPADIDLRGQERPREFSPAGAGFGRDDLEVRIRRRGAASDPNLLMYAVEVRNNGDLSDHNVVLSIQTPSGTRFETSIADPGVIPKRKSEDLRQVEFGPISELRGGERFSFQITVVRESSQIGDFLAKVTSDRHPTAIIVDDRTP